MKAVIAQCLESLTDLTKWDEEVFEVVCRTACGCGAALLEAIDDELAKDRVEDLRMISRRPRTIVTKFGNLKVMRRMYRDGSGRGRFLLDEALGLIPGSQATASLQAVAIKLAAAMPFRQAAAVLEETSGGVLSHQMVHRTLQSRGAAFEAQEKITTQDLTQNGELPKSQNKKAAQLFVEADGTMINLQRQSKRKAEVKLVTAHEGWERVGKSKYKLKDKTILAGLDAADATWDRFTAKLLEVYHPSVLSHLVIGGDGASWIKDGAGVFAGSFYQLDRFHLRRAMLRATGNMTSASKAYSLAAVGDTKGAIAVLDSVAAKVPKKEPELKKAANYLKTNVTGLVDYRHRIPNSNEEMRGLGAIESNIDKVLANRMKKRGMAWGYSGAHHMAKVIQMLANGEAASYRLQEAPEKIAKPIRRSISESLEADPAAWLASRMPALVGPHQGRPWVKALRNLSGFTTAETRL